MRGRTSNVRLPRVSDPASELLEHAVVADVLVVHPGRGGVTLQPEQHVPRGGVTTCCEARVDDVIHVGFVWHSAPGDADPVGVVVDYPGRRVVLEFDQRSRGSVWLYLEICLPTVDTALYCWGLSPLQLVL